ncbi:hypothetical protein PROFUN_05146 [Planoprotostelium fungivorum]|uniref:dolichol kinase n=1 Tax=Planoprotostelium fungivorum TaxID=1890364 RepID=A0A2P6NRU0_9EUKA|nr:hypothetical protein PROFUN_05146 [Planoprotostelium fungivorum]
MPTTTTRAEGGWSTFDHPRTTKALEAVSLLGPLLLSSHQTGLCWGTIVLWLIFSLGITADILNFRNKPPTAGKPSGITFGCFLLPIIFHLQREKLGSIDATVMFSIAASSSLSIIADHLIPASGMIKTILHPLICLAITIIRGHRFTSILAVIGALLCSDVIFRVCRTKWINLSLGESVILSQGASIAAVDLCRRTLEVITEGSRRSDRVAVGELTVLGSLAFAFLSSSILISKREERGVKYGQKDTQLYVAFCVFFSFVLVPWAWTLINRNPFVWLIQLMVDAKMITLLIYWSVVIYLLLYVVDIRKLRTRRTIVRKYFHLIAVLLFVPTYELVGLGYSIALGLFILAEIARFSNLQPIGPLCGTYMERFFDEKDGGDVVVSHTYLLLGCAAPLWIHQASDLAFVGDQGILAFAGLISLGVGDSLASTIGTLFGSHRWPGTKKTLEGTAGAVIGCVACCMIVTSILHLQWPWVQEKSFAFILATIVTCLTEAWSDQVDNLFLPLYYYGTLVLSLCRIQMRHKRAPREEHAVTETSTRCRGGTYFRKQTAHMTFFIDSLAKSQVKNRRLQRATPLDETNKTAGPAVIFLDNQLNGCPLKVYSIPDLDGIDQLSSDDVHAITTDLESYNAEQIDNLIISHTMMFLNCRLSPPRFIKGDKFRLLLVARDPLRGTSSFSISSPFRLYSKKSQIEDSESLQQRERSRKKRKSPEERLDDALMVVRNVVLSSQDSQEKRRRLSPLRRLVNDLDPQEDCVNTSHEASDPIEDFEWSFDFEWFFDLDGATKL